MYRRSRVVAKGFHDDTPNVTIPASLFTVLTIFRLKQFVVLHTLILISIQLGQAWLPFSQQLEGPLKLDIIPDIVCFQGLQCMQEYRWWLIQSSSTLKSASLFYLSEVTTARHRHVSYLAGLTDNHVSKTYIILLALDTPTNTSHEAIFCGKPASHITNN